MRQSTTSVPLTNAITIRRLTDAAADVDAVRRLAERDSNEPLDGAVLVAEVEGTVLAAISLADGRAIADPFSRTDELRTMLELRAKQLRRRSSRIYGFRRRRPAPARGSLAGSPPGAGGRLLDLRSL